MTLGILAALFVVIGGVILLRAENAADGIEAGLYFLIAGLFVCTDCLVVAMERHGNFLADRMREATAAADRTTQSVGLLTEALASDPFARKRPEAARSPSPPSGAGSRRP